MQFEGFNLQGKVAIVTGAGTGIGRAVALGLAQAGSNIVLMKIPLRKFGTLPWE